MKIARSIFFFSVVILSTIVFGLTAVVIYFITKSHDLAHSSGRLWGRINLRAAGVRVSVKGLENIDPLSAYIYAANHQSWFDIFTILGELPVQFRWLAKKELFKVPFLGQAMTAIGHIPIDRSDHRKSVESLNHAAKKIQEGTSVVIFPEGTRSPDGSLQEFRKGGFILAIKSKRPIVPVAISGSYSIFPKGKGWLIRPGTIQMIIGKPIPTSGMTTRDRDSLMRMVRESISEQLTLKERGLTSEH
jgi:1-acyl-sn-glycerol-3-phosphate acyltransferase